MKRLLVLLLITSVLMGCDKDLTDPNAQNGPCPTGEVQFINGSDDTYDIIINGNVVDQQAGNTSGSRTLDKGSYNIQVKQVSGYRFSPIVKEYSINIVGCDTHVLSYP